MHDPDLLAVQRKRRQEGRCLRCNKPAPRATLCRSCRAVYRYCPMCESVFEKLPHHRREQSSEYCWPCQKKKAQRGHMPREEWVALQRAKKHTLLNKIIKHYRDGLSLEEIGVKCGRGTSTIGSIIRHARDAGHWPAKLKRVNRPRLHKDKESS